MTNDAHSVAAATKKDAYLQLAEEVLIAAGNLIELANAFTGSAEAVPLTRRDQVLIALARKVEGSLRAVVVDVNDGRSESMHHLKTMTEAFIYYHVVFADGTQDTASLVLAKTYNDKAKFYRLSAEYYSANAGEVERWERARDLVLAGKDHREALKQIENVADLARNHSKGLGGWYALAYRLASEPAHIGDLYELMPGPDGRIVTEPSAMAEYRAIVAVDMALHLCVGLLRMISENNEAQIRIATEAFEQRLATIRELAVENQK